MDRADETRAQEWGNRICPLRKPATTHWRGPFCTVSATPQSRYPLVALPHAKFMCCIRLPRLVVVVDFLPVFSPYDSAHPKTAPMPRMISSTCP